jgi:L-methionine (R)-S-oxide reductase
MNLNTIYTDAVGILEKNLPVNERLQEICVLLNKNLEYYDWVGFYLVDPTEERMLELGPYVGAPTDHTRIPFGTGICGQAAETLDTFVVPDVSKASNYLACSLTVKSEIVIPIMKGTDFWGELDIDSHRLDNFSPEHRDLLERICLAIGASLV